MDKHRKSAQDTEDEVVSAPETPRAAEQADGSPRSPSAEGSGPEEPSAGEPRPTGAAEAPGGENAPAQALRDALEAEREKYLRLAAEFDNFRKRMVRERQEAGWRAQGDLVLGLLESLDDLMRFADIDPASVDTATVVHGVAMVEKKVLKSLGGHGLEVINPVDHPFDPAFHEAVATEPALSKEDDHLVARVYQPGYVFRGQLLRPARVVVKQWLG